MTDIKKFLREIGLNQTEAELYLAGLEYASVSANQLAKHTDIQRTTIYNALETLIQKGFVSKHSEGGNHMAFRMIDPAGIEKHIESRIGMLVAKKDELQKLIPQLRKNSGKESRKTFVAEYNGIDGIKLVVEEALYCRSRRWDIIAPRKNFFSDFDESYARYFLKTRQTNSIQARTLWERESPGRKLSTQEIGMRNPRFLPVSLQGKFKSVIILFDDKIGLISSYKEKNAVLIQSEELTATLGVLFEGLWSVAEAYR